jgi:biopolymer transport protein ExbD
MSFPVSKINMKRLQKSRGRAGFHSERPQLTSLIDVMTCLLIYLLQSFSTEGEIVSGSRDLLLPESSATQTPKLMVVLTVNNEYILAENVMVANVKDVLASDDMVIAGLDQWLETRRLTTEKIGQYHSKVKFTGEITIQGDKRIRFRILKKIMYTCGQQGFNNFSLAVLRKEG